MLRAARLGKYFEAPRCEEAIEREANGEDVELSSSLRRMLERIAVEKCEVETRLSCLRCCGSAFAREKTVLGVEASTHLEDRVEGATCRKHCTEAVSQPRRPDEMRRRTGVTIPLMSWPSSMMGTAREAIPAGNRVYGCSAIKTAQ